MHDNAYRGMQLTCAVAAQTAPVSSPPVRVGPGNVRSSPLPKCAGMKLQESECYIANCHTK